MRSIKALGVSLSYSPSPSEVTPFGFSTAQSRLTMDYHVTATRIDAHGGLARAKDASLVLDTDMAGRRDAFNPVELLLAAIAACMIKGIERVTPILAFEFRGVEVRLKAVRQDAPPRILRIDYELIVDTDEDDRRLELLHRNVRKYGTISNTIAAATVLEGNLCRRVADTAAGTVSQEA